MRGMTSLMFWLGLLAPPSILGFALSNVAAPRVRKTLLVPLIAIPILLVAGMILIALGGVDEADLVIMIAGPPLTAWIVAATLGYFAGRRLVG
jgi:lipopolysaccharide export LptBFGC system permease protein LptF